MFSKVHGYKLFAGRYKSRLHRFFFTVTDLTIIIIDEKLPKSYALGTVKSITMINNEKSTNSKEKIATAFQKSTKLGRSKTINKGKNSENRALRKKVVKFTVAFIFLLMLIMVIVGSTVELRTCKTGFRIVQKVLTSLSSQQYYLNFKRLSGLLACIDIDECQTSICSLDAACQNSGWFSSSLQLIKFQI